MRERERRRTRPFRSTIPMALTMTSSADAPSNRRFGSISLLLYHLEA
jgi:hypothetical protein